MSQPDLFVGTQAGLFRIQNGKPERIAEGHFTSLTRDGSQWWAILNKRDLMHSEDLVHWRQMGKIDGLKLNTTFPTAAGLLVGTSEARFFIFRDGKFTPMSSFDDRAPGRKSWYSPIAPSPDVRSFAIEPSGTLYVNVHVGGILRTDDEGRTWTPTIDYKSDVHQVHYHVPTKRLLAASARGLGISEDQGRTWRFETRGLHGIYLRCVVVAGNTALITAGTAPYTNHAAVYRMPVAGNEPLERCTQGLPPSFPENIETFWMSTSGSSVAFGAITGNVYLSHDEGVRWTQVAEAMPEIRCVVLA